MIQQNTNREYAGRLADIMVRYFPRGTDRSEYGLTDSGWRDLCRRCRSELEALRLQVVEEGIPAFLPLIDERIAVMDEGCAE